MSVKVQALDHPVINVADVMRTVERYRKVLGMDARVFDPGGGKAPRTSLLFGRQKINVRRREADIEILAVACPMGSRDSGEYGVRTIPAPPGGTPARVAGPACCPYLPASRTLGSE